MHVRVFLSRYRAYTLCPQCHGTRFKPETLNFRLVIGEQRLTLPDLQQMPVEELAARLAELLISERDTPPRLSGPKSSPGSIIWSTSGSDILPWTVPLAPSPAAKCNESI